MSVLIGIIVVNLLHGDAVLYASIDDAYTWRVAL